MALVQELPDLTARGLDMRVCSWPTATCAPAADVWPRCDERRCWNHEILNVLGQVPLKRKAAVREHPRAMLDECVDPAAVADHQGSRRRAQPVSTTSSASSRVERLGFAVTDSVQIVG